MRCYLLQILHEDKDHDVQVHQSDGQKEHGNCMKLIQSPISSKEYKILAKVADLPSGKSRHCHVHWDSRTWPQAHHEPQ